jgi:hypothetical protein
VCPSVTISATSPSTGAVSIGQVLAGRVLIERHLMPREDASAQRIHQWMHDHPEGAKEVRRQNRQIVLFRIVGLDDDTETIEPGAPSVQRLARVRSRKVIRPRWRNTTSSAAAHMSESMWRSTGRWRLLRNLRRLNATSGALQDNRLVFVEFGCRPHLITRQLQRNAATLFSPDRKWSSSHAIRFCDYRRPRSRRTR